MAFAAMNIRRTQGEPYGEVIDVCNLFGVAGRFGTAPNALLHMLAESPTYREGLEILTKSNGPESKDARLAARHAESTSTGRSPQTWPKSYAELLRLCPTSRLASGA